MVDIYLPQHDLVNRRHPIIGMTARPPGRLGVRSVTARRVRPFALGGRHPDVGSTER
jgi:hypothetical protein